MALHSQTRVSSHLVTVALTITLALPAVSRTSAESDPFDETLNEAVAALAEEDYQRGLRLLRRAGQVRDDPRVTYYQGYALEKLGRCQKAQKRYREAARTPEASEKLRAVADEALVGLPERCPLKPTPLKPDPVEESEGVTSPETDAVRQESGAELKKQQDQTEPPREPGGRLGWKFLGWSTAAVGTLVLLAVPVKSAAERTALAQSKPYFRERYGCEVDFGEVTNEGCDEAALREDELFGAYQERVQQAKRTTTYALLVGGGLVAVGAGTLVTLLATRRPSVALIPDRGGVRAVFTVRF